MNINSSKLIFHLCSVYGVYGVYVKVGMLVYCGVKQGTKKKVDII